MEDWVIDTKFLGTANEAPNRHTELFRSFLNEFKEKRICLRITPKIYGEYQTRCGVGFGRSWAAIWYNKISNQIKPIKGNLPNEHKDYLTKKKFHFEDFKFVTACFFSDKKRLSSTDTDYSNQIKTYLSTHMGISVLNIDESINTINTIK